MFMPWELKPEVFGHKKASWKNNTGYKHSVRRRLDTKCVLLNNFYFQKKRQYKRKGGQKVTNIVTDSGYISILPQALS